MAPQSGKTADHRSWQEAVEALSASVGADASTALSSEKMVLRPGFLAVQDEHHHNAGIHAKQDQTAQTQSLQIWRPFIQSPSAPAQKLDAVYAAQTALLSGMSWDVKHPVARK
ncbi:MAG: hypothetical protein R8G34_15765 [Paracoccaceae bacterium]|nr:hypothetical protein [Paracoccaceae bacterium]